VRAREWESKKCNFFVMFFHVCVFCYYFACGVFYCAMIFVSVPLFIDERIEKWCKRFVLIAPIAPIILLLVNCAEANVFLRKPHIGGIFINIRSFRMSFFYLKLSCKGSLFFPFSSFLTKYTYTIRPGLA
jgi:hypothetical protein